MDEEKELFQQENEAPQTDVVVDQVEEKTLDEEDVTKIVDRMLSQQKKPFFRPTLLLYLAFTLCMCGICSYFTASYVIKNNKTVVVYTQPENTGNNNTTSTVVVSNDLSSIVENIENTVVEVYTEAVAYSAFYGEYITGGAGSGVIYSKDGYIITNNHVIENATNINVTLHDGTQYPATLIATDETADLAVIKIDAENLQCAILGSSDNLKVGNICIAIGNPLGTLGGSVTSGIISALSREVTIEGKKMHVLQIDTAINPGNSGGGLFDINGNLIGIVNAKSSGSDIEGIGFAIPVNYVNKVVGELIEYGYVIGRAQLGIKCTSIDSIQAAWRYGFNCYGVLVNEVNSPKAKEAGLKDGDLIVGIDDTTIASVSDLKSCISNYSAGDVIQVTIVRENSRMILSIELEQKTTN